MIHCCAVCAVFKKSIDHAVIFTKSETRTSLSCENQNSSLRGKDQTNEIKHTDTETLPMNHPSTALVLWYSAYGFIIRFFIIL
ncbi:hypothetical protein RIR_jg13749.t1 [Rhizophagus irregularis DAOM 181602=DAOM 197198]|nr:hypothetical protein RIR_jg13749.t1 [Rhizophagus irregularis DAOM 181602=DAOM 197198]